MRCFAQGDASSSSSTPLPPPTREDVTNDDGRDILELLETNARWAEGMVKADPEFFKKLGQGQSPNFLYIGCSDSRVCANTALGLRPGDVFVHRNVGNLIHSTDLNALSVLEYAVSALKVKHIIVAGHYDCGAIRAAMKRQDLGLIENWLRSIRDVYRLYSAELDAIDDLELRHRRLVELNVYEQCLNLYKTGVVQRHRLGSHADPSESFAFPRIHGLVFDPNTGLMRKLPIDFKKGIGHFQHIYDLYDMPDNADAHFMLKKNTLLADVEEEARSWVSVGDEIRVADAASGAWSDAELVAKNEAGGTFDVRYTGGGEESGVPPTRIRLTKPITLSKSSAFPATDST